MNAALHVPSGVLMSTSFSVTGRSAADAAPVAATMPAAMPMATKSRRVTSAASSSFLIVSSLIAPPVPTSNFLLLQTEYFSARSVGQHVQRAVGTFVHRADARVQIAEQVLLADDASAVQLQTHQVLCHQAGDEETPVPRREHLAGVERDASGRDVRRPEIH